MTKKPFKANKVVNLKNFIAKPHLKINKKQNDRKCTRQYKKTIFNSDGLSFLINQRIRIHCTAWQIHAVMQMGWRGFGVAGFADIADDLSFFHAFIQADAGEFVEVGIVMPCARPLDADDFATQSVAPDFSYDTGRRTAYRRVFLSENIHTFMSAPLAARCAPSVVKTLAFNRVGQALRRRRFFRPQFGNFGVRARQLFGGTACK